MTATILPDFLDLAVPLEVQRLRRDDPAVLCRMARECGQIIAEHGDLIQFRARGTARSMAALVRGLAAAALVADGGVTFAGRHWCADHSHCEEVSHGELPRVSTPRTPTRMRPVTVVQLPE